MSEAYQIIEKKETQRLAAFVAEHGQAFFPLVSLVEQSQLAVEDLMDVMGRAGLEAVLLLSAKGLTGAPHPGKRGGEVRRHGSQGGRVTLKGRKLKVRKPRLRRRGQGRGGEVEVPAYAAMQADPGLGERMLDLLMRGVSTRNYAAVLPELAETVGVSKSAVSRESIEAAEAELRRLCERRFDDIDLLILYLDGLRFGAHHVIVAVGVDTRGQKHVLGLRSGATENATVVTALLEELVERGVRPGRRRLFVIDGSRALRAAIDRVYGGRQSGAAVPQPQGEERDGPPARGVEGPGEGDDEGGLAAGAEGGDCPSAQAGPVASDRASGRGRQPFGGSGGDLHRQPLGSSARPSALPGEHEPDRESLFGGADAHPARRPLAGRGDGEKVGRFRLPRHREELPSPGRLPGPVDPEGRFGRAPL